MTTDSQLVSIIMPTYNCGAFIAETIAALIGYAEGRGARALVVGTAITHPTTITSWFASALPGALWKE